VISSAFIPLIEGAVAEYIGKWQERPAPGGASWEQQHDPELLKDELRPLVFEEVRQQVRIAAGDDQNPGDVWRVCGHTAAYIKLRIHTLNPGGAWGGLTAGDPRAAPS
jgi:hypothetical protein